MNRTTVLAVAVLFVAVSVPAVAGAAIAGPFTTSTPIPSTLTDWSGTLAFQRFNGALGTLLSVQLDFTGLLTTQLTITNNSDSPSSGTAKTELQVTVQDAGSNLTAPVLDLFSPTFAYSLAAGQTDTSGVLSKNGSSSDTYTLAAILSEFTGAGNISLNASTFTQTLLTNTGGNTAVNQVSNASLTGTVTYVYTPIPEPATMSLLVLGGVALLRRRNHR